ncbi:MAG: SH3 domain-containing protein, partial [Caldilineaceae bacterium]|nr:SH3 domain-containing protein [Caldilineaceae bacterium]
PATGIMFLFETARLRGAPSLDTLVITAVENEEPVDIFGITEAGDWMLIRIPGQNNVIGWMFRDLVFTTDDLSGVPLYRADGIAVDPQFQLPTPVPGTDTPTPTPTPRTTPPITPPQSDDGTGAAAPGPLPDEVVLTVDDEFVPGDARIYFTVENDQGDALYLDLAEAQIQVWAGLLGPQAEGWVPAPFELIAPGTTLYAAADTRRGGRLLDASRVRVVKTPDWDRFAQVSTAELAGAIRRGDALTLTGGPLVPGVFLLDRAGTLQQIREEETRAAWVSGADDAGMVLTQPSPRAGDDGFTWVRNDGGGVRINAQPLHTIYGVAGDPFGGVWWVEVPEADLDQWQLWHYEPATGRLALRLATNGEILDVAGSASPALTPMLVAARPTFAPGEQGAVAAVELLVDTFDRGNQKQNTGVYRLSIQLDESGRGTLAGLPQKLLAPGVYQGPVRVSPAADRLAFLAYDAEHASLTSGIVTPPNQLKLLTLAGRGASTVRTLYATETAYEFLAPALDWLDNNRLVFTR